MSELSITPPIRPERLHPHCEGSGLRSLGGRGGDEKTGDGAAMAGEEEEIIDVEDVQPLQTLTTPDLPSRAIVEAHRIDHWPYRSWCSESVEGFDNEPAIVNLLQETLSALKVSGVTQASEEHPPPYDSQANGSVESAVKQIKGRIRTLKFCLERRIGKKIPPRNPVIAWFLTHSAALLRYRLRASDGKTPYET